ncbi:deleted in malignant brain tumors 1 protein-like [Strongylocentrotus purpuratus]|uniref:SRCR domain-containing protein n=1 Tax=Strongylocentrotus purpuratus TaxID=7668 RepID=A0A7M7NP57_STRPU|nr:deleted in malignant brain tumors 1 protein-like [Strongylocentrotus purpuratus]
MFGFPLFIFALSQSVNRIVGDENATFTADEIDQRSAKDGDYAGCFPQGCLHFDYVVNISESHTLDICTATFHPSETPGNTSFDTVREKYNTSSNGSFEGTVHVDYQGVLGTVCADDWDLDDAHVVCHTLGYPRASAYYTNAFFGEGIGEIILDNVNCTGSESNIAFCQHNGYLSHNCEHRQDAGVTCDGIVPVRLVDGASPNEGRVEVNYQGTWGTICDDSWDINDATVVCRMLGYPGVSYALVRFGETTGDIFLDDVECEGSETHIAQCTHGGYGIHNCDHSRDVGIICSGAAKLKVRLVDGPDESQGRIELFYFGSWGTVCHYSWTSLDSEVVCRMLGFVGAIAYSTSSSYGRGTGEVLLRWPRCSGKESSLLECDPYYDLDDLRVRLVGGKSDKEGRVEILYLGTWGTVCDDNWDLSDANVVCRMLGYERAENFSCCAAFGPGPGPIVLDEVECEGTEANIGHCRRSDYEAHDCDHSEDVGVLCIGHGNCSLNTTQNETEQEQQQQR